MNDLLTGGVLLTAGTGLVIALWSKLKALGWRLLSLFVVRFQVEGWAESSVQSYLWKHGRRSRFGERAYSAGERYVKSEGKSIYVGWESVGRDAAFFVLRGWIPVLAEVKDVTAGSTHCGSPLVITFLRGTLDPDALMIASLDEYNQKKHYDVGRYRVQRSCGTLQKARRNDGTISEAPKEYRDSTNNFRFLKWSASDIGTPTVDNPFGTLSLPDDIACIRDEARKWLDSEAWYRDRSIPWRIGYMLAGIQGSGKSSVARALAMSLDIPILAPELATYDDEEFIAFWHSALSQTPCMVLLEDIDTVYHGRESVKGGAGFGCLLNCLSGAEGSDGIFIVCTTNRIEQIDPALLRPGRCDRVIEFTPLDESCRRSLITRILSDCPDAVEGVVRETEGMTGCQVQEKSARIALDWHWRAV